GDDISFMEYIHQYGHPSETVYIPNTAQTVPVYGLMAVLAAATSLADCDVLGNVGMNCGLIFLKNTEGKVYEALVVKIDPGYAFEYNGLIQLKNLNKNYKL